MIDAKAAVETAVAYLTTVYEKGSLSRVRVEELEMTDDIPPRWLVTIGFDLTERVPSALDTLMPMTAPTTTTRDYKQFVIDSESGRVRAMRMRRG